MTFIQLYQNYLALLWDCFQYDCDVFSKPWLYAWLVPVCFYLMFFFIKWVVLTAPLWIPFSVPIAITQFIKVMNK